MSEFSHSRCTRCNSRLQTPSSCSGRKTTFNPIQHVPAIDFCSGTHSWSPYRRSTYLSLPQNTASTARRAIVVHKTVGYERKQDREDIEPQQRAIRSVHDDGYYSAPAVRDGCQSRPSCLRRGRVRSARGAYCILLYYCTAYCTTVLEL